MSALQAGAIDNESLKSRRVEARLPTDAVEYLKDLAKNDHGGNISQAILACVRNNMNRVVQPQTSRKVVVQEPVVQPKVVVQKESVVQPKIGELQAVVREMVPTRASIEAKKVRK